MTTPSAPYKDYQHGERVAALEAETRAERQYTSAQLLDLSSRLGVMRKENQDSFDEVNARLDKRDIQLRNIEIQFAAFINQGKGAILAGRIAMVTLSPIGGILGVLLLRLLGLK